MKKVWLLWNQRFKPFWVTDTGDITEQDEELALHSQVGREDQRANSDSAVVNTPAESRTKWYKQPREGNAPNSPDKVNKRLDRENASQQELGVEGALQAKEKQVKIPSC